MSEYDEHALALENMIYRHQEEEKSQKLEHLCKDLKSGRIKTVQRAQYLYGKYFSLEDLERYFIDYAKPEYKEPVMRQLKNSILALTPPDEFLAYLSIPLSSYESKTGILKDAIANGALNRYSEKELAFIVGCHRRTISYAIATDPALSQKQAEVIEQMQDLHEVLRNDPNFQSERFESKQAWIKAVLEHPEYSKIRGYMIARIGQVREAEVSTERARLAWDKQNEEKSVVVQVMKVATDDKKPNSNEREYKPQREVPKKVFTLAKKEPPKQVLIGKGEAIVSEQKIDHLLLAIYPQGIPTSAYSTLPKLIKQLKQAIKSKG